MKKSFIPFIMIALLIGGTLMGFFFTDSFWFWLGATICGSIAVYWLGLLVIGIVNSIRKKDVK